MEIFFGIIFALLALLGWFVTILNITYSKWPVPVITGLLTILSAVLSLTLFGVI